jgi:arginine/serine-rich splicing factor 12
MEQAVMTGLVEDPLKLWRQAADKLPKWFPAGYKRCALFVPIPHLINGAMAAAEQRIEFEKEHRENGGNFIDDSDVARTVYAGNVNSSITEDMLADFFSIAGNVTYVKFAGSEFNPSRFGFVEFDTKAAAESAKALSGTQVAEMTLKVKHSNNPIVKDRMRNFWGTCGTERRRRMRKERSSFKRKERELLASGGSSSEESESSSSSSSGEERRRRRRRRREREDRSRDKGRKDKDADEGGGGKDRKDRKSKEDKKSSREKKEENPEKDGDEDEKRLREDARRSRKSRRKSEGEGKDDAA